MVVKKYVYSNIVLENLFCSTLFRIKMECLDCCNDVPHYKAISFIVLISGGLCYLWLIVCQCHVSCYLEETAELVVE
jgi:hypothetical protein